MGNKPCSTTARRGVLLLVVLSLLAMFGLIAITYLIVTNQARRTAQTFDRIDQQVDPPELELNQAAMQVIRGTRNPTSAVGLHSLLEDMYGGESVEYTPHLTSGVWTFPAAPRCNGQFVAIPAPGDGSNGLSLQDKLRRVGCVLTINSGSCAGVSSRIVSFQRSSTSDPVTDPDYFLVMAFPGQTVSGTTVYVNGAQLNTGSYLLNGVPFSGTGFGYNPATGRNDLEYSTNRPFALLPRPFLDANEYRLYAAGPDGKYGTTDDKGTVLPGPDGMLGTSDDIHLLLNHPLFLADNDRKKFLYGADGIEGTTDDFAAGTRYEVSIQAHEDYDATDFQNMLPALIVTDSSGGSEVARVVSPSLHRPELINYWYNQFGGTPPIDFRRRISLRPWTDVSDHPNFDGGNPSFNPINGPWDVDNDRDGVPDSIWVDLGSPVRSASDGRQYKPLYAILLQDLDSRVNVNAHGSTAQLAAEYTQTVTGPYANATGQVTPTGTLPRGEGYGPADVNPGHASGVLPAAQVANLLRGSSALGLEGRYGESAGSTAEAGVTLDNNNRLGLIKHFEFPADYSDVVTGGAIATSKLSAFGTPPDLWGRGCLGLDHRGQPLYWRPAWTYEVRNNPYWLNLSRKIPSAAKTSGTTVDNPFTVAELERVLRQFDGDAGSLAGRLAALAPGLLYANGGRRHAEVTTESNDLPVPGTNAGWAISAGGLTRGRSLTDLLRERIIQSQGLAAPYNENAILGRIRQLAAWELLQNRRVNLNRPLGNGLDTQPVGNKVVDEVGEATNENAWDNRFPNISGTVAFQLHNGLDVNGDGAVNNTDQALARQLYARHLFVMALLLIDFDYLSVTPPGYNQDPTADPNVPACADATLTAAQRREITVRRIAQWAVNVVDFRDADSAMTPFEYVLDPFDARGWNVDSDLATDEATLGTNPGRRLVWGCEYPELLLTETLAFHDRRVADTNYETATGKTRSDTPIPDLTLDQPRIPQGSAFFELYCTRNPNNVVAPGDLYDYDNTNGWRLDLARLAPAGANGLEYPVWRLVITETARTTNHENDVLGRFTDAGYGRPYSFTPDYPITPNSPVADPMAPSLLLRTSITDADARRPMTIDRIVWFTTQAPTKTGVYHENWNRIFYNRSSSALLAPGNYALVGPRTQTWVGSQRVLANPNTLGIHADQGISLGTVSVSAPNYTYPTASAIQTPLGIVVATDPPEGWTAAPNGIGISISEPLPYSSETAAASSYYPQPTKSNPSTGETDAYGDLTQTSATGPYFRDEPLDSQAGMPLHDENLLTTGTTTNYKTVLLQRLADPLRAYDSVTNPYLTVDWMPIDLTVFNGEDRPPSPFTGVGQWDPDDANPTAANNVRFEPRRRGAGGRTNVWYPAFTGPNITTADSDGTVTANFRHYLNDSTLGYVNETYGIPWSSTHTPAAPAEYRGVPCDSSFHPLPFPWLTWNNRPFANPMEVLLVPTSHPGRLCREFGMYLNTYAPTGNSETPYDGPLTPLNSPYSHLLNFFGSNATAAHAYRLLDYLETPSRFIGTETVLNPHPTTGFGQNLAETTFYRPPFNMVSEYRDPGRININMVTSERVWNSLMNGHGGATSTFADLVASRRGYSVGVNWWDSSSTYPTRFLNPFRSAGGAGMVTPPVNAQAHTVNATLLRAQGETPEGQSVPLFAGTNTAYHVNYQRNAYFRYQSLGRLSNLVTTRSNTYALWITVGYFEVEPNPAGIDAAHPDGFRLGQELGSDANEVKRHRAFYIIDRTIPVGFQRGVDLNAENTILLKRVIE